MFIRLKTATIGSEVNVNINNIKTFAPALSGEGSSIHFTDGSAIAVQESCRSIRGYSKKAMMDQHSGGASVEDEETPQPAPAAA